MTDSSLLPADPHPLAPSAPATGLARWSDLIPSLLGMPAGSVSRPSTLARQLLVIVLYVAAARLMMLDPWFTGDTIPGNTFTWRQSSVITLLGLLMVSAIAFEWHLLGVSKGLNLVGQIVLAYPFTLFVARLLGRPWHQADTGGVIGALFAAVRAAGGFLGVSSLIPAWVADALSSPGTALVLLCSAWSPRSAAPRPRGWG